MGLNLRALLDPAPVELADLSGETVAVDVYGMFYQFLTMLRDGQGRVLTDDNGHAVSHLIGLLSRTEELLDANVLPVYVFDGPPHPLKLRELERRSALKTTAGDLLEEARAAGDKAAIRKHAAATTNVTREMVEDAVALLEAAGLPYVMAPQDAEAQCAVLAAEGKVDAAASQDYDTLVYGAPRILRNLTATKRDTEEILLAAFQINTGLDRDALVDLALLVGNDFHEGVKGVGPKTAHKLLTAHGGLGAFFDACGNGHACKGAVERRVLAAREELTSKEAWEIRKLFLAPPVDHAAVVRPGKPDATALHERLVEAHGFGVGRADRFASSVLEYAERRGHGKQTKLAGT